jgi:hypothetical protein
MSTGARHVDTAHTWQPGVTAIHGYEQYANGVCVAFVTRVGVTLWCALLSGQKHVC